MDTTVLAGLKDMGRNLSNISEDFAATSRDYDMKLVCIYETRISELKKLLPGSDLQPVSIKKMCSYPGSTLMPRRSSLSIKDLPLLMVAMKVSDCPLIISASTSFTIRKTVITYKCSV